MHISKQNGTLLMKKQGSILFYQVLFCWRKNATATRAALAASSV